MIDQSLIGMLKAFNRRGRKGVRSGSSHYKARLTEDQVIEMRRLSKLPFVDSAVLAAIYGVDRSTIRAALTGKSWGWL